MSNRLFRRKALKRLSSPEQLDLLLQVTTPKGWVALLAIGGLILCAFVWGVRGVIPTEVAGEGILMKSGGTFQVFSKSGGIVRALYFNVNDRVKRGQVIARIAQPDILQQIRNAKLKLMDLEAKQRVMSQYGTENMRLERKSMEKHRENLMSTIANLQGQAEWFGEKIINQKELVRLGLITKQDLFDTEQQLRGVHSQIHQRKNDLEKIKIQALNLENQRKEALLDINAQIDDARIRLETVQKQMHEASTVVSPYTGRIIEVRVDQGAVISTETPIMSMELLDKGIQNLKAVLFFPPAQGKKIKLGMKVKVSPSTVEPEEYGFMLGIVTCVSDFPASNMEMMRVLGNNNLVKMLSLGGGPIEVWADLIPDPRTPSGYKWSSSKSPPIKLHAGTLCGGAVTVEEQRPIDLVIPLFKKYVLGITG